MCTRCNSIVHSMAYWVGRILLRIVVVVFVEFVVSLSYLELLLLLILTFLSRQRVLHIYQHFRFIFKWHKRMSILFVHFKCLMISASYTLYNIQYNTHNGIFIPFILFSELAWSQVDQTFYIQQIQLPVYLNKSKSLREQKIFCNTNLSITAWQLILVDCEKWNDICNSIDGCLVKGEIDYGSNLISCFLTF